MTTNGTSPGATSLAPQADSRSPTSPPKRKRLEKGERRAQLLSYAVQAFAERGLERATHADVARLADTSVPTVFAYFPSRQSLVSAVLGEIERFLLQLVEEGRAAGPSPADKIFHTIWRFAESTQTHPAHVRVWLDWSTAIRDHVWPRYLELQDQFIAAYRSTLAQGQADKLIDPALDLDDAARIIVGEGHMVVLMCFAGEDLGRVKSFLHHLVSSTLHLP